MLFFRWLGIVFAIFISDASAGLENAVVDRNEQEGKGGGCRDWIPHISTAYDSVITVLDEVVSTLEGLQHSEPVETAPNKKYLEYFRVNSMFQVLLNTNVLNEGGGLSSRAKTYLGNAKKLRKHIAEDSFGLICGGEWIELLGPYDPDPQSDELTGPIGTGNRLINEVPGEDGNPIWPQGVIYAHPTIWPGFNWFQVPERLNMLPMCEGYEQASTIDFGDKPNLCLCYKGYSLGGQDVGAVAVDLAMKRRTIRDRIELEKIAMLPVILLHEATHMWLDWDDADDPDGTDKVVYGFPMCRRLAKVDPARAAVNPDNFALLSMALYMDKWLWFTGSLQTLEALREELERLERERG